jgi:hypothetical protein
VLSTILKKHLKFAPYCTYKIYTVKTMGKLTFFSSTKPTFLNAIPVWIYRDRVEKLNFGSSFMSKDLHSQAGYHRLAIATFWRTFQHDGKISPAW